MARRDAASPVQGNSNVGEDSPPMWNHGKREDTLPRLPKTGPCFGVAGCRFIAVFSCGHNGRRQNEGGGKRTVEGMKCRQLKNKEVGVREGKADVLLSKLTSCSCLKQR